MAGPLRLHVWDEYTDVLILIAKFQIPIFGVIVGLGVRFALKSDYNLNFPWTELLTCSLMYCFPILFSVNSWWGLEKSICQTRPSPGNVSTKFDELYLFVKRQHGKVCQQWHGYILPVLNDCFILYIPFDCEKPLEIRTGHRNRRLQFQFALSAKIAQKEYIRHTVCDNKSSQQSQRIILQNGG